MSPRKQASFCVYSPPSSFIISTLLVASGCSISRQCPFSGVVGGLRMGRGRTLGFLLLLLLNLCLFIREKESLPWDFCLYLNRQNWVTWLTLAAKECQKMSFYVYVCYLF